MPGMWGTGRFGTSDRSEAEKKKARVEKANADLGQQLHYESLTAKQKSLILDHAADALAGNNASEAWIGTARQLLDAEQKKPR